MHRLTEISLAAPRATGAFLLFATLAFAAGLPSVRTEVGYRPLLGGDHPSIRTLERFIETFGGGLPVLIVWECGPGRPCDSALDATSLRMAHEVSQALSRVPGVRQVQSPARSAVLVSETDGFAIRRLVQEGGHVEEDADLRRAALEDPLWAGNLFAEEGSIGVIHVGVEDSKSETSVRVMDSIERILAPFEAKGFEFHLVGHAVAFAIAGRELVRSTLALVPMTTLIIGLILFGATRSWRQVVLSLGTLGIALAWTFGFVGWLGWPNDNVLQVLAPLILVVGVCDSVHLLSRYGEERHDGGRLGPEKPSSGRDAILRAARGVSTPCLLTTLTTAIAFLSFATSDLDTFVRFGVVSAFGVAACLLLTFTLLPILLARIAPDEASAVRASRAWQPVLMAIARTSERRAVSILLVTGVLCAVFGTAWALRLRVDTNWYEMFGEQSRVVRWIRFVESRVGTLERLELEVELPPGTPVHDPATLREIGDLSAYLTTIRGLGPSKSILDPLAHVGRALRGTHDPLDQTNGLEANAELLELLSIQQPDVVDDWLSFDRRKVRISVEAGSPPARERGEILAQVRDYVGAEVPESWSVRLTGPFAVGYQFVNDLQATQLRSFPTAAIVIFVTLVIFLRSVLLSIVAMIPTLVPVIVTLGAMGLAGVSLDLGRAMIGAVLIGIAVDDSVHLLGYYRTLRARQLPPAAAIRGAVLNVGRAVVTTSMALALGALTFLMSPWQTVSSFGFYMALAILGALAADLFVLPALVFAFARRHQAPAAEVQPVFQRENGRRRGALMLVVVAPVVGTLSVSALDAVREAKRPELACWLLPNVRVAPLSALDPACPLFPHEQIHAVRVGNGPPRSVADSREIASALEPGMRGVEVSITRGGETRWIEVPLTEHPRGIRGARVGSAAVIAGMLLSIPLLLILRSASSVVAPFSFFYSAIASIGVVIIAGRDVEWLVAAALGALVLVPAILTHLALTFPRERKVVRDAPFLRWIPYVICAPLALPAWVALDRDALLWPMLIYLLVALTAGAWLVLLTSCWFAIRESTSALERTRARLLCYGALALPILPTLVLGRYGKGPGDMVIIYLGVCAMAMPLPIGLAISRYNLFNLGVDARAWTARLIYLAAAACLVTLVFGGASRLLAPPHPVSSPAILFGVSFAGVVVLEPLRTRLVGLIEGMLSPRIGHLLGIRERFAREVVELHEEDAVAQLLATTLHAALSSKSVSVFLHTSSWRPAYALGVLPPMTPQSAADAADLLGDRDVIDLGQELEATSTSGARLRAEGVEATVLLHRRGEQLGLALLKGSRTGVPYSRIDLDFLSAVSAQASVALHNARLLNRLLAAERHATTGQIALALAHDVGKELDWLHRIATRLPERLDDERRVRRDLSTIGKLAEDLAQTLGGFIHEARQRPEVLREGVDHVVEKAAQTMARLHGIDRITRSVDPRVRSVPVDRNLERVVANLLDNALLATADPDPVHLFVTGDEGHLRITVADRGCGMTEHVRRRAFDAGFTTRAAGSGLGIGLAVSREIVQMLGGSVELQRHPSGGTVALVTVPLEGGAS